MQGTRVNYSRILDNSKGMKTGLPLGDSNLIVNFRGHFSKAGGLPA